MEQQIDLSPQVVAGVSVAGIRFLNLETTLIPGNLRKQLDVLEVILNGLGSGQLVLAPKAQDPVESGLDKTDDPDKREPTPSEIKAMQKTTSPAAGAETDGINDSPSTEGSDRKTP